MSEGMIRATLKVQLTSLLSLEHLKSFLTLYVASGSDSKRPKWGLGEAVPVQHGCSWRLKALAACLWPDVQLTSVSNSAHTAGVTPTSGSQSGVREGFLQKIISTIEIKWSVCVCEWMQLLQMLGRLDIE